MNRGTRTLIVLAVAVIAAVAASYGVYTAIRSIPERRVEVATRNAVVAKVQLPVGTLLTSDLVKIVPWPERAPVQGGFTDVAEVLQRGLIAGVVENEPITESKLAPKEAGGGMPPMIQPGMRAMSVRVNDATGVAGFVTPGTRVDVLAIIARENGDPISRVVVSNVQVLTSGTRFDQEEAKEGNAIRSAVVTLMVGPPDAERIALAQNQGELMLTLRNPMDVLPTESTGVTKGALFGGAVVAPVKTGPRRAAPAAAPAAPPVQEIPVAKPYLVETLRLGKRSQEKLAEDTAK